MSRLRLTFQGRRDLLAVGPRLKVAIAPPFVLPNADLAIPEEGFVQTEAIIDTGSAKTVIEPEFANRIGLHLVDPAAPVARVGGIDTCPVYVAAIRFPEELATIRLIRVLASPLPMQPVKCLIGRDVLQRWRMVYDGRTGEVVIEEDETDSPLLELD